MTQISSFESYDRTFNVEPPVEVGDRTVYSLGMLATLAAYGPDYPEKRAEAYAGVIDDSLEGIYRFTETDLFSQALTKLAAINGGQYVFSREEQ